MLHIFTAHKRSLRRLCFYTCLSVHGGGACMAGAACMARGGCAWQGACMVRGMCGGGACMAGWGEECMAGGVAGGHAWLRGTCMVGACMAWGACMAGGMHGMDAALAVTTTYGQWAGGTHPTGMHSCGKTGQFLLECLASVFLVTLLV